MNAVQISRSNLLNKLRDFYALVVRLKRFTPGQDKLVHPVEFSAEWSVGAIQSRDTGLDLPPAQYALFAVVVHLGETTTSGHYVAYVRRADGYWWKLDDARVACDCDCDCEKPPWLA